MMFPNRMSIVERRLASLLSGLASTTTPLSSTVWPSLAPTSTVAWLDLSPSSSRLAETGFPDLGSSTEVCYYCKKFFIYFYCRYIFMFSSSFSVCYCTYTETFFSNSWYRKPCWYRIYVQPFYDCMYFLYAAKKNFIVFGGF